MRTERCLLGAVALLAVASAARGEEFQGVDSAANWLSRRGSMLLADAKADTYGHTLDCIAGAGFRQVRERLTWDALNPAKGKFTLDRFLADARAYEKRGVLVDWIFHSAPKWTQVKDSLPTDLMALYDFCRTVAAAVPAGTDWEYWNEEDIGFCKASAWDYAATAKAAYLGFKAGRRDCRALMGALCKSVDGAYNEALFANGLGFYTDVFNYHIYAPPSRYEGILSAIRRFCGEQGVGGRAVWITENGTHQEGSAPKDGVMPGLRAHSPAQELVHAEFAVKSQVMLRMAGVSRSYFFVFPPYNERGGVKDWGLMRRDGTLKPGVDWFRKMNAALRGLEIVGEMKRPAEGVRAFLFADAAGGQTVMFWAESAVDSAERVDAEKQKPIERPFGLRKADGRTVLLVARRRPGYLSGLSGLTVERKAAPKGTTGATVAAGIDPTLVLKVNFAEGSMALADSKSTADVKAREVPAELEIWNFSGKAKTVSLVCEAGRFLRDDAPVAVPAFGKAVVAGKVEPADSTASKSSFSVRAVGPDGKSTPLTVPITNFELWRSRCEEVALGWRDPANWRRNDSASERKVSFDEKAGATRFDLTWKDRATDRWAYPYLTMDPKAAEGAAWLAFEVRSEQDKVENDFMCANVIADYGKGESQFIGYEPPIGNWETRRVPLKNGLTALRIGMNPKGSKLSFWVRNVVFLRDRAKGSK